MMTETTATETVLRHDRLIVGIGLGLICLLSWVFLLIGARVGMSVWEMSTLQFPPPVDANIMTPPVEVSYWLAMLVMWWVMMIAMMVPSAAPMVLLYGRVYRHAQKKGQMEGVGIPTAAFVSGYLLGWLAFSLAATALQWGLEYAGLVHSMKMWSTSEVLSGVFLIAAGLYQATPLKNACLEHCRSPVEYLSRHWRKGPWGAARMGLEHGIYCVGCCWFLMVLLLVGGVMNLVWIIGLAVLVLVEKLARYGPQIGRALGLVMFAGGSYLLLQ